MIELETYGFDAQATDEVNQQALQAALDASAACSDPYVTCAAGTYGVAGDGQWARNALVTGRTNFVPAAGTKFLLKKHAQVAESVGFRIDNPVDFYCENLEVEGIGIETYYAFVHNYNGADWCRFDFKNVKIRKVKYGAKAYGGRTSCRLSGDNDWLVYTTPFIHTHPDVCALGALDEITGGHWGNIDLPTPVPGTRDHCFYHYPGIDVVFRDNYFDQSAGHAIQSNHGDTMPDTYGSLRVYNPTIGPGCVSGIHSHPRHQTEIVGGTFRMQGPAVRWQAGGGIFDGGDVALPMIMTNGHPDFTSGAPECAFLDDQSMDFGGVIIKNANVKFTPAVAFVVRNRPSLFPWLLQNNSFVQEYETLDDAIGQPYGGCFLIHHETTATGVVTLMAGGNAWIKRGRLFNLNQGSVGFVPGRPPALRRNASHTQDSYIAPGAYAPCV